MKELEKVIIKTPFEGCAQTFLKTDGTVAYSDGLTFEQYCNGKEEKFQVITWDEYHQLHENFFTSKLREISEDDYYEMLYCLPPLRWHDVSPRFNVFFCSEATSGILNGLYVYDREKEKFYAATKSRFLTTEQILGLIQKELPN